jgi:hypothetical protein
MSNVRAAIAGQMKAGQKYRHLLGEARPEMLVRPGVIWFPGSNMLRGWDQARCWELGSRICFEGIGVATFVSGELIQW